jgi:hypothetical protein
VSEEGLPHAPVRLWVSGESWRAAFAHVALAEDHGRDDWQDHQVKAIHGGMFYPTRLASPRGTPIPFTPQASLVVYRPTSPRRRAPRLTTMRQLLLFE